MPTSRKVKTLAARAFAGAVLSGLLAAAGPTLPAATKPVHLMAFGDSLTHGYGLGPGETFPEQLEAALRADGFEVTVLNAGNSGDTTAGGLARLDWALADDPDAMILELGANDGLRGLDPQATYANLDAMLTKLENADIPVLLAGMLAPPNLGREYGEAFNAIYPRLAAEHGVPLYPFFLEGVAAQRALNQGDGIHPNAKGVAEIVAGIKPYVVDLLKSEAHAGRAAAAN